MLYYNYIYIWGNMKPFATLIFDLVTLRTESAKIGIKKNEGEDIDVHKSYKPQ